MVDIRPPAPSELDPIERASRDEIAEFDDFDQVPRLADELRDTVANETSQHRKKQMLKRLKIVDAMRNSGNAGEQRNDPRVFINPEIVWKSEETAPYEEGCLSIPDQYAEVKRPASVTVEWLDLDGTTQERTFSGLWATCVQHEIDHLDGKLFIDYVGPLKRQMITRKMEKLKRERARGE